ncbi:MAG: ABC transporter ATP-binding protein [Bacteroidota bacterium]
MITSLKRTYKLLTYRDRLKLFLLLSLMLIGAFLEMIGIGSIPAFIVLISNPVEFFETFSILSPLADYYHKNPEGFFMIASFSLIALFLFKNIFLSFVHYLKTKYSFKQQYLLGLRLFKAYSSAPRSFHVGRNSAEILRNVNNEVTVSINAVLMPFLNLAMDVIMIIWIFVLLFSVDPLISFITLIGFAVGSYLFLLLTNRKLRRLGREELSERKIRNKIVIQTMGGLKELTIYHKVILFINKFRKSAQRTSNAQAYKQFITYLPKPFLEVFAISGIFVISAIFITQGRDFENIIPIMTLFGVAAAKSIPAIKQILQNYTLIKFNHFSVNPIYNDINELKDTENNNSNQNQTSSKVEFNHKIEIENINFKYPEKRDYIIKNFNAEIIKGSFTIIKGSSGVGKTTLLDIISGIIKPIQGQIMVDGKNINNNLLAWQEKISYVPQNIFLFDDSLINNVTLGMEKGEINLEQFHKAIALAQLDDIISDLPEGIDTFIGEQGVRLSGGQRQRIGIARAIYHQPELLILDEATSEVDRSTERKILEEISARLELTMIFIGHKHETLRNVENIKEINLVN